MRYFYEKDQEETDFYEVSKARWGSVGVQQSIIFDVDEVCDDVIRKKGKLKSGWYWHSIQTFARDKHTWRGKELPEQFHHLSPVKVINSRIPYSIEGWGRECRDGWVSAPSNLFFSHHSFQRLQERYRPHQIKPEEIMKNVDQKWIDILCDQSKGRRVKEYALLPYLNGVFVCDTRTVRGMDVEHQIYPQLCKTPFFSPTPVVRIYLVAITFLSTFEMSDHQLKVLKYLRSGDHRNAYKTMIREKYRSK